MSCCPDAGAVEAVAKALAKSDGINWGDGHKKICWVLRRDAKAAIEAYTFYVATATTASKAAPPLDTTQASAVATGISPPKS